MSEPSLRRATETCVFKFGLERLERQLFITPGPGGVVSEQSGTFLAMFW